MGHKVNPFSYRLIQEKNWQSKWFSRGLYPELLAEDLMLRNAVLKRTAKTGGIARVEIGRNAQEISIAVYTSKPGIIIGRSGSGINDLKKEMEKMLIKHRLNLPYFLREKASSRNLPSKIKLDIIEVRNPELTAKLVAQNVAAQLVKRIAYRRAIHQAAEKTMEKGAKGVKIAVAGRLGGVEIARKEKFSKGTVPLATIRADIDYASADAFTTYGVIGVKVWIYKGLKSLNNNVQKQELGK